MAEIIAMTGMADVGKSVIGIKLASDIYNYTKGKRVIFVSPDTSVPTLGLLLPHRSSSELFSLGQALDRTEVTEEDIMEELVVFPKRKNFGILAFRLGEDRFSYPSPTPDKADMFVSSLSGICDYIIADTSSSQGDIISAALKRECDVAVELYNPTLKCMIYESARRGADPITEVKKIKVMNVSSPEKYIPEKDMADKTGSTLKIRYSPFISHQSQCGLLCENIADAGFKKDIRELTKEVLKWKK